MWSTDEYNDDDDDDVDDDDEEEEEEIGVELNRLLKYNLSSERITWSSWDIDPLLSFNDFILEFSFTFFLVRRNILLVFLFQDDPS